MMKKTMRALSPLLFAAAVFCFYILVYPSPVGSGEFAAAVILFFCVFGGTGIILFTGKGKKLTVNLYFLVSLAVPLALVLWVESFSTVQHRVIYAVNFAGMTFLKLFVAAHVKYERAQPDSQAQPGSQAQPE